MPVLIKEQELLYGKFTEQPSLEQLTKYFWLDDEDFRIIFQHRNDYAQVRDRATIRLWNELLKLPNENQVKILKGLLLVDEKNIKFELDVLRQPPRTVSVTVLGGCLKIY